MPKVGALKKRTAHVFNAKWRSNDVILNEEADFASLLLSEHVLKGLRKTGFKKPSPIQLEAIPFGRYGKDLFIQAKSGTGKTLVFTIVALEMLQDIRCPQVLILSPTREIADQIREVITSVGVGLKTLTCCSFIGGIPLQEDRAKGHSCQIAVGTPGRVKQLIAEGILPTNSIRLFVLDEADVLLNDKSFEPVISDIFHSLPKEKQVIATSATYPKNIKNIIQKYFREPYLARLEKENLSLLGTIHYEHEVQHSSLVALSYKFKLKALEKILESVKFVQCLVFCNQVTMVELLCKDVKKLGFSATYISSAKEQQDRLKAIDALKRFKCKVLVCTDLTSRGIDAENVDMIINFDCPSTTDTYLHRVGRAGRYGARGVAITLRTKAEIVLFQRFQKDANFKATHLPNPLPQDLIKFVPNYLNDSDICSEDVLKKHQNGCTDIVRNCNKDTKDEKNSTNSSEIISKKKNSLKLKTENSSLTCDESKERLFNSNNGKENVGTENNLHSTFECANEKSNDVDMPNLDQNILRNANDVENEKKKTNNEEGVKNETEQNTTNLESDSLLSNSMDVLVHQLDDVKIESEGDKMNGCHNAEHDQALCVEKIVMNLENNDEVKTKSSSNHLQGILDTFPLPKCLTMTCKETSLLTQQTFNDDSEQKTSVKQTSSGLNETSNVSSLDENNECSKDAIQNSVSKFISNYEEKENHFVKENEEEMKESNQSITLMPVATKKCVTQKDVKSFRENNNFFFYNVLKNHYNNKSKQKAIASGVKKNDSTKDLSQLKNDDENLSKQNADMCLKSDKLPSDLESKSVTESSCGNQLNIISEMSSQLGHECEDLSNHKDNLESTPIAIDPIISCNKYFNSSCLSSKSNVSSNNEHFKNEMERKVIYSAPDADNLITNYYEGSDDVTNESSDEVDECSKNRIVTFNCEKSVKHSNDKKEGNSYSESRESCDESEEHSYEESGGYRDDQGEENVDEESEEYDEEIEEHDDEESEEYNDEESEEYDDEESEEHDDEESEEYSNEESEEYSNEESEEYGNEGSERCTDGQSEERSNEQSEEYSDDENKEYSLLESKESSDLESEEFVDATENTNSEISITDVSDRDEKNHKSKFKYGASSRSNKSSYDSQQNIKHKYFESNTKENKKGKKDRLRANDSHSNEKNHKSKFKYGASSRNNKPSNESQKNVKHKYFESNIKENKSVKKDRFRANDTHSNKYGVNDTLFSSTSSYYPNVSHRVLTRDTTKAYGSDKSRTIYNHNRRDERSRRYHENLLVNQSQTPLYTSIASNCPQVNYNPQTYCNGQNTKCFNCGHSSMSNNVQHGCSCCRFPDHHCCDTSVSHPNRACPCKLWYQTFYNQYLWIQHTASHISKNF